MRIKTWLCGFLMLPFFSLTSCDTTSQNTSQTPTDTVDILEDTRPETVEMTTITTLNGDEVTYNKNTRRIITLSGTGDVLALGIRPYACDGNVITTGYEDFFTDEVSILNYTQPFNSEELMMYHPDVILVYDTMDISDINKLKKVASQAVIPIYYEEYDYAKRLTYLGELFGLEDNAKKVIEQIDEMIASYVDELEKLNLKGKTLTVFSYYSNGICIPPTYRDGWTFNKILYQDLGMTTIETVTEYLNDHTVSAYNPISQEKLKDYEGELVLFADITSGSGEDDLEVPTIVQENVGWQSLKAVQEDRVGVFNAAYFAYKDVLYLEHQYELLLDALKVAAE